LPSSAKEDLAGLLRDRNVVSTDLSSPVNLDPIWADPRGFRLAADVVLDFLQQLKQEWHFDTIVAPVTISPSLGVLPIAAAACYRADIPLIVWISHGAPLSGGAATFPTGHPAPKSPILIDGVLARGRGISFCMLDLIKGKEFDMQGIACIIDCELDGEKYVNDTVSRKIDRPLKFRTLFRKGDILRWSK